MQAKHIWKLGFSMSSLAKLEIRQDKLANLNSNAFEATFEEHNQKFEFC